MKFPFPYHLPTSVIEGRAVRVAWGKLGRFLLAMVLLCQGLGNMGAAEATHSEKMKTPLVPETEKALEAFRERGLPIKIEQLSGHMQGLVKEIDEVVHLTPGEIKILNDTSKLAVNEAVSDWKPRFIEALRPYLSGHPVSRATGWINDWKLKDVVPNEPVENWKMPDEREVWIKGVNGCLGPERSAAWGKVAGEKRQAREKEIAEYVKTWAEKSTAFLAKDVKSQIEDFRKTLSLPAAQTDALDAALERLINRVSEAEIARATVIFRGMTKATRKNMMVRKYYYVKFDGPAEARNAPQWETEVRRILTQEQFVAWEKARAERDRALAGEIAKDIGPLRETLRDAHREALQTEIQSIRESGGVSAEHVKLLEAASKAVVDGFMDEWQKKVIEMLTPMSEKQRSQVYARQMGVSSDLPGEEDPRKIPAWKPRVNEILSPEERQHWEAALAERETKAVRCLGRIALAEMDKRVLLDSAQREKLEPTAQELARKFILAHGLQNFDEFNLNVPDLVRMLAGAKEECVRPLLDEAQWGHWKAEAKDDDDEQRRGLFGGIKKSGAAKATGVQVKAGARRPEPPSVDAVISEHLDAMGASMAAAHLAAMQLRVEEAARTGGPSPEAVARLTTAAKGAVEMVMASWRSNMDGWVRRQLKDANPQNVRPRLEGVGRVSFGSRSNGPEETSVWKNTVEEVMPEDRRKAWKREQDARRDYANGAMAEIVIRQLQNRCPFNPEQEKRLDPLLQKVIAEYGPDLQNWVSQPWYLSSYYRTMPLAGIPEKDLGEALGPQRLKLIKDTVLPQAGQYWDSIKQQHAQRLRHGDSNGAMIFSF